MESLESQIQNSSGLLHYHMQYTKNHLFWIRFIQRNTLITPKLLYLVENRVFAFFDPYEFDIAKKRWHFYLSRRMHRPPFHFRIIEYADDMHWLIKNWYANIKNLKVEVSFSENCFRIILYALGILVFQY